MSLRKSTRLQQSSLNEETLHVRRSSRIRKTVFVHDAPSESEQYPRKKPIGRGNNKKQKQKSLSEQEQLPRPPLVTSGHEMPPGETMDGVPVVVLPSSPEEEKPKCDLFLPEPPLNLEDRQHLLNAASVFKYNLVARLKNSADNLSRVDMLLLASSYYDMLEKLGDDYTSFHSEVQKLITQHQKVKLAGKVKESWNEWDIKARYVHQVQGLSEVRQKLSSAQDKLSGAKTKVNHMMSKKEELTDALHKLTDALRKLRDELYEEEERIKTLTVERDQIQEAQSDIEVELGKVDAEYKEASLAFKAYDVAKEEFERIYNHLLQLVKK